LWKKKSKRFKQEMKTHNEGLIKELMRQRTKDNNESKQKDESLLPSFDPSNFYSGFEDMKRSDQIKDKSKEKEQETQENFYYSSDSDLMEEILMLNNPFLYNDSLKNNDYLFEYESVYATESKNNFVDRDSVLLAFDNILFQDMMLSLCKSKEEDDSQKLQKKLILFKFLYENRPCDIKYLSDIKSMLDPHFFSIKRLMNQINQNNNVDNVTKEQLLDCYKWCINHKIIDEDYYEIKEILKEDFDSKSKVDQKEDKKQFSNNSKINEIHQKILQNLNKVASHLNQKGFLNIKLKIQEMHSLVWSLDQPIDLEGVITIAEDFCECIANSISSFYKDIIGQSYSEDKQKEVEEDLLITEFRNLLKCEKECHEIWKQTGLVYECYLRKLSYPLLSVLSFSFIDNVERFTYALIQNSLSFLTSKKILLVNWELVECLLNIYKGFLKEKNYKYTTFEEDVITIDLKLIFSLQGKKRREYKIPIHCSNNLNPDNTIKNLFVINESLKSIKQNESKSQNLEFISEKCLKEIFAAIKGLILSRGEIINHLNLRYLICSKQRHNGSKTTVIIDSICDRVTCCINQTFGELLKSKSFDSHKYTCFTEQSSTDSSEEDEEDEEDEEEIIKVKPENIQDNYSKQPSSYFNYDYLNRILFQVNCKLPSRTYFVTQNSHNTHNPNLVNDCAVKMKEIQNKINDALNLF